MNWAAAILSALAVHVLIGASMSLVDWTEANEPEQIRPEPIETLAIIHFAENEDDTSEGPAIEEPISEPEAPEPAPAPPPMIKKPQEAPPLKPMAEALPPVTVNPIPARSQSITAIAQPTQTITRTVPVTTISSHNAPTRSSPRKPLSKRGSRAQKKYLGELMAWLAKHKEYEASLKKDHIEGIVKVRFTISKSGEILSAEITESSGYPKLDAAALNVLKNANPVPAIPSLMERDQLTLTLPIDFSLITE